MVTCAAQLARRSDQCLSKACLLTNQTTGKVESLLFSERDKSPEFLKKVRRIDKATFLYISKNIFDSISMIIKSGIVETCFKTSILTVPATWINGSYVVCFITNRVPGGVDDIYSLFYYCRSGWSDFLSTMSLNIRLGNKKYNSHLLLKKKKELYLAAQWVMQHFCLTLSGAFLSALAAHMAFCGF